MGSTNIGGISFPNVELHTWAKQHTKEQFYSRAKKIYWTEFEETDQKGYIDQMWAVAEKGLPKVEKPKEVPKEPKEK
jgi:hypothetical protein